MQPETFMGQTLAWWLDECDKRPHAMMGVELPQSWVEAYHDLYSNTQRELWASRCRLTAGQVTAQEDRRQEKREMQDVNKMSVDNQPRQDYSDSPYEAITVEHNSRGVNVKVRVVKQEGQSDVEWVKRMTEVYKLAHSAVN